MIMLSPKTRTLLASMRIANLPGVASHVVAGGLLAWWLDPGGLGGDPPWPGIVWAAIAGVLLCVAGNLLNDWHDVEWDRRHRPERALPAGHFRPRTYWMTGAVCLLVGVAMMFSRGLSAGMVALGIAACVVIYTRVHKRTVWSVVPLALCRGLLPWMGAQAVLASDSHGSEHLWMTTAAGAGLFFWVCGLSLDARRESTGEARRSPLPLGLILLAPVLPLAMAHLRYDAARGFELLPALIWLCVVFGPLRHTAKQRVSGLLAGLPLLDFILVAILWNHSPGAPMFLLWLPLLAFASGRALQRLAAAT
jgi:4-hydroxybenzoate polyprenyltransferase